jgi:hypothetical protein
MVFDLNQNFSVMTGSNGERFYPLPDGKDKCDRPKAFHEAPKKGEGPGWKKKIKI